MSALREEVAVAGWAQTEHKRVSDETPMGMMSRVVNEALASCNMTIREVEVIVDAGSDFLDGTATSAGLSVDPCGAHFKSLIRVAGDSLLAAINAYLRVASGTADSAVVVSYGKSSESDVRDQVRACAEPFFMRPLGLDALAAVALQESVYLNRYGVSRDACADVVVKNRAAGVTNPYAQVRSAVTREEVLASPERVYPVRDAEVSRASDGACAVVIVEGSVAAKLGVEVAWMTGIGHSIDPHYLGARDLHKASSAAAASRAAMHMAGVESPADISAFELTEYFAVQELMLYEALGLCGEGEASDFLSDQTAGGGPLLNGSGGTLCANPLPATGLVRLLEAAAYVTGRRPDASDPVGRALAHSSNGFAMQSSACVVLER